MQQLAVYLRHAKRSNKKELDLSGRELNYIPKEVFTMRYLQELDLSNNKIITIEPEIKELLRLKVLNLENNALIDLPEELAEIPFLTSVKIKGNPLPSKYEPLMTLKLGDNLQDILTQCFEGTSPLQVSTPALKGSTSIKKNQTPSWLAEEKKEPLEDTDLGWQMGGLKQDKRLTTATGRFRPKVEVQQYEPQCQSVNGVLTLRMNNLEIGEQISMGGFSTIHKGKYFDLEVAVKKVFNPNISDQLLEEFNNEVNMLAKYRHPNIVLMIGAITKPPTLCLAMQLVKEGTLFDLIHKRRTNFAENDLARIASQMAGVIAYLHRHGIVHRDIKSHNMLLDRYYNVKLCDFGLAKHKSQLNSGPMQFSGTPTYMAPELFEKRAYNESVDVFALGTLLYELYAKEVPYHGLDPQDIKVKVVKDSSLPPKMTIKKSVLQLSKFPLTQLIGAERVTLSPVLLPPKQRSSVIGESKNLRIKIYIKSC